MASYELAFSPRRSDVPSLTWTAVALVGVGHVVWQAVYDHFNLLRQEARDGEQARQQPVRELRQLLPPPLARPTTTTTTTTATAAAATTATTSATTTAAAVVHQPRPINVPTPRLSLHLGRNPELRARPRTTAGL
jgi:hypothetical protein